MLQAHRSAELCALRFIRPVLPLAHIGTASSTKQRDKFCHHSRRFRLGGEKEVAGAVLAAVLIYGISIAFFLIGPHSNSEFDEFRSIRHACFSMLLLTSCDSHPIPDSKPAR
jgi:hypothetical protein